MPSASKYWALKGSQQSSVSLRGLGPSNFHIGDSLASLSSTTGEDR